jgi:hypothetical protein
VERKKKKKQWSPYLGLAVYTMDHEVGPWKIAFVHGPTFMVRFL